MSVGHRDTTSPFNGARAFDALMVAQPRRVNFAKALRVISPHTGTDTDPLLRQKRIAPKPRTMRPLRSKSLLDQYFASVAAISQPNVHQFARSRLVLLS